MWTGHKYENVHLAVQYSSANSGRTYFNYPYYVYGSDKKRKFDQYYDIININIQSMYYDINKQLVICGFPYRSSKNIFGKNKAFSCGHVNHVMVLLT